MKTSIKTFIASALTAVVFLTSTAFAKAIDPIQTSENSVKTIINSYMDSYKTNNSKNLNSILSADAVYKYNRETKTVTHSAKELVRFIKKNDGVVFQGYSVDYQLLSQNNAVAIAKVEVNKGMGNASHQYVTLENDGNGDWKITQIYQVYGPTLTKGALVKN
jgi:hypothetical protein